MAVSKGRKGIFFTFAAIAMSLVIIFSFNAYTNYGLKDKMESIEARIDTMNNFIKGMEKDMDNAIFIVGFRRCHAPSCNLLRLTGFENPL